MEDCLRVMNTFRKRKKLVGDEDMEEMYGSGIKGDILNHCYKCKTCGELANYRKYRWNNNEDNDGKTEDNDRQSEGDGDDRQSVLTVDEYDNRDNESELDYGGPNCPECGTPKMWDWSKLKADGKDEKSEG